MHLAYALLFVCVSMFIDYTIQIIYKKICGFSGLCMISPLMMMCAPTTLYGYPIVDGAHPWQL